MNNEIYLSTGAFTGRKNGRDYRLAIDFCERLECDGYEFMIFEDFHENFNTVIGDYRRAGLNIPVIHAEKAIGDLAGGDEIYYKKAIELFKLNCAVGELLGSGKIVLHAWGYPASDRDTDLTCLRLAGFIEAAAQYNLDPLVENIPCVCGDPLDFLRKINSLYPNLHYIIDTRHAQFHRELEKTLASDIMGLVRHIHIGEYSGGYKEWKKNSAEPRPGEGDIDWPFFFGKLKEMNYPHSITVEASAILEIGVDVATLNRSLNFIRDGLK